MPLTRDQRCMSVLRNFFEEENILNNNHYELKKQTHRGWKVARYEIEIPEIWYTRSPRYDAQYRQLIWVANELTQTLPARDHMDIILEKFKSKFEPFEKSIKRAYGSRLTSFLRINDCVINDKSIKLYIMVQYDKEHIPFPEIINTQQRLNRLERENENMRNTIRDFRHQTERYISRIKRINMRLIHERDDALSFTEGCHQSFKTENDKYMNMYRNIINEQYLELKKTFECPVCYDKIENDKIFTTPCNHVLCIDCTKQCKNKCPLCRDDMCFMMSESV